MTAFTQEQATAAIDLLARLVAFDTTSHKSNMEIVRFVESYLSEHGITSHLVPTADGAKAGLFATIGPEGIPGVGLSGHTDVVPVDGQTWTSDPFTMTERNNRLYGRGTADMKGFLACVLAAVPHIKKRKLKVPIHIIFSYDEEVGCLGVRPMIDEMGDRLVRPRMVIVGEPTSMRVVDAHKGPVRWHVEVRGRAAHSSMAHLGVNAIIYASRLIAEIDQIEQELKNRPPIPRFEPAYPTVQVTTITGGTATNIVPISAAFECEVRTLPGFDPNEIEQRLRTVAETKCLPEMQAIAPEAGISIKQTVAVPPFGADPNSEVVTMALKLTGQNETFAVSYATEAGLFQSAGAPSVVIGPGDIAQAHTPDEWIDKDELAKCMGFLARLTDWAEA